MAKQSRTLQVYKSYNFVDKDPVIDLIRGVVENSGKSYTKVNVDSGVSTTTLRNWFFGKTRRPQFCTVAAVARACGNQITIGNRRVHALRLIKTEARVASKRRAK